MRSRGLLVLIFIHLLPLGDNHYQEYCVCQSLALKNF